MEEFELRIIEVGDDDFVGEYERGNRILLIPDTRNVPFVLGELSLTRFAQELLPVALLEGLPLTRFPVPLASSTVFVV